MNNEFPASLNFRAPTIDEGKKEVSALIYATLQPSLSTHKNPSDDISSSSIAVNLEMMSDETLCMSACVDAHIWEKGITFCAR